MSFHVLNLYMHEIATQPEKTDEWKQANSGDTIRDALASDIPLTPAHINALSSCLTAIDGIFEVFLSMEISSIRCLPVFNFVRVAYAVVVLIKMYFAASSPNSELGKVINKDNMKVEQHLDNLLEKFGLTAAADKSRPASKFLVVLVMLRSWFHKQKGGGAISKAGENTAAAAFTGYRTPKTDSPPTHQAQPQAQEQSQQQTTTQQSDYSTTANTPLQLLSEIATKENSSSNTNTAGPVPTPGPMPNFYWGNRHHQQPFMYDDTASTASSATPANPPPLTPAAAAAGQPSTTATNLETAGFWPPNGGGIPWLDAAGFDYPGLGLGDGFSQAMDLTLAGIADGSMMGVVPPGAWDGAGNGNRGYDAGYYGGMDGMGMGTGGSGGYQY